MKPQRSTIRLLVAIMGCGALLASVPAHADRDHRHSRYNGWGYGEAREWPGYRGYERGYERGHKHHRRPIKEKVIVREYRYYEPREPRRYRHQPTYRYSRDPAIVIGVNLPPIIIPLR
jgi:hypothetical protein